jgi:serine/threonine protein phosphatase 1
MTAERKQRYHRMMSVPVEISAWKPAPFALKGEQIFAVGDVHGCSTELSALLDTFAGVPREGTGKRRLVYLGDIIDRGYDNIGALTLWAEDEAARGVDRIDRLMGNHEQLLMLAVTGGPYAAKAEGHWLTDRAGGGKVLAEMRAAVRDDTAPLGQALLAAALGERIVMCLNEMRSHATIGNALFVHGGLDGQADQDEFLARPWTSLTGARWAWITTGFLDWTGGFNGTLVVHGHTPPIKHFPLTGQEDPHLFLHDRLGLDGGSAITGIVTAAEIQDGRYRIFKAGTLN